MARLFTPRNFMVFPNGYRKPVKPVLDLTHPLSRGIVGCYLLGENTGPAIDISPTGNSRVYQNTPTVIASHHGGMATTFNGTTQLVTPVNVPAQSINKFTIGCWARVTGGAGNARGLIGKCNLTGSLRNYNLAARAANVWGIYFTQGANNFKGFDGSVGITLNVWTFVAATYDGTTIRLYVNGVADGSTAPTGNPDSTATVTDVLSIGATTGSQEFFPGNLDGVRIYNRALNQTEILQWYLQPYAGIYQFPANNRAAITSVSANVNLTGVSASAAVGSFGYISDDAVGLVGVQATAAVGTFTIGVTSAVALAGVSATTSVGTFSPTVSASVALTGVQATAYAGDLTPVTNFLSVPMITIMNANPIPVDGGMTDDEIPGEGILPYQIAFDAVVNLNPIPMTGTLSAVPVPAEGSVP